LEDIAPQVKRVGLILTGPGVRPNPYVPPIEEAAPGLAACRTDVFVVRQPLWFGRSMLTWEA
jgi:hypothetical protein